jgi:hypothetical protein
LATEIFPLAQNENSKKSEQLTENLAMKFCALLVVRQNFFRIIFYNNLFKTTFHKQFSSKVAKNLDWKSQNFRVCPKPKLLATNGPRPRAVADLRTEFSPLKIEFLREK